MGETVGSLVRCTGTPAAKRDSWDRDRRERASKTDDELEFVNQQVLDYFGKTAEEMKDWRGNGAIHPDDLGRVVAAWTDSLQTGRAYDHVHARCVHAGSGRGSRR